jgi:hypothetical protein
VALLSGLGQVNLGDLIGGVAGRLRRPVDETQHPVLKASDEISPAVDHQVRA